MSRPSVIATPRDDPAVHIPVSEWMRTWEELGNPNGDWSPEEWGPDGYDEEDDVQFGEQFFVNREGERIRVRYRDVDDEDDPPTDDDAWFWRHVCWMERMIETDDGER